jgi:hypothetical protein
MLEGKRTGVGKLRHTLFKLRHYNLVQLPVGPILPSCEILQIPNYGKDFYYADLVSMSKFRHST